MNDNVIRYDLWIEDALKSVIRRALVQTSEAGLPGEHHFYITFDTGVEGVQIPGYLHAQHPDEMTIVIQHQFDDLIVEEDLFAVTLRFQGKPERLVIPFEAVSGFADPSVNFGLQLKLVPVGEDGAELEDLEMEDGEELDETALANGAEVTALERAPSQDDGEAPATETDAPPAQSGEVIALDAFRKK